MERLNRLANPCAQSLSELLARAGVTVVGGRLTQDVNVTSLTDDSRSVVQGSCFVARRGCGTDGHQFVEAAVRAGAAAIVVDQDLPGCIDAACVRVQDTRVALAKLAAAFFGLSPATGCRLPLIGITGTNGKTTVAWLIRSILDAAGRQPAMLGTIEYDLVAQRQPAALTTPGPVELCRYLAGARDAGATHAVIEVSSHALDQHRCDGLEFAAAVFTNLTGDHLDYHRTTEAYCAAKRRLFEMLDATAVAVVNADDRFGPAMAEGSPARTITYGIDASGVDLRGRIKAAGLWGSAAVIKGPSFEFPVRLSLVGRHNVMNALAAAATAWAIGESPDAIRLGLERLTGVPGRLQRAQADGHPFSVLIDYAHTDDALKHVLQALRPLTRGRLICVFGCGGDRDCSKRPRMAAAVGSLADVAFVTSDNPRTEPPQEIIGEILVGFGGPRSCRVEVQVDRQAAIESAIAEARPGDTVLIAGKGHETHQLVGDRVLPFDDLAVARACLGIGVCAGGVS